MERTPERLNPPADASVTCPTGFEEPLNVIFGGVGGSGIAGDIIADYAREQIDVPVSVCRAASIPKYAGRRTLFVAVSYSGETQETLGLLEQARRRRTPTITITSGGRLLSKSKSEEIPYLRLPAGLLPRVALPELIGTGLFALEAAGLLKDTPRLLREAAKSLAREIAELKPEISTENNRAKEMALALTKTLPLLIGSDEDGSVLRRFKNELNENSKMPAFYYTLSESYHNDVEGLKALSELSHVQPIFLLCKDQTKGEKLAQEKLHSVLMELGFERPLQFEGVGPDRLSQLLTAITFGDYVSVYLAALRGVDPSQLTLIPEFRETFRAA